jgi:hypothetical protein
VEPINLSTEAAIRSDAEPRCYTADHISRPLEGASCQTTSLSICLHCSTLDST